MVGYCCKLRASTLLSMWCSTQKEQGCELHIVGLELNQEDKAPNCNTDKWNGMVDFLSQMTSSDASINIEFNSRTANHLRNDLYVHANEKVETTDFCCRWRDVMNGVVYAKRVKNEQQPIYLTNCRWKKEMKTMALDFLVNPSSSGVARKMAFIVAYKWHHVTVIFQLACTVCMVYYLLDACAWLQMYMYICSTQVWTNLSHHVLEYLRPIFLFDRTSIFYGIFFPLQNELLAMGYYDKVLNP